MRKSVLPVTMLIAGAVVSACSAADSTRPGGALPMTVSFSTAAPTGAARSTSTSASASVTFTSGTDVLVITKAQLVVARMELARSGASCTSTAAAGDDNMNEHDCAALEVAPTIVSLPVDSSVVSGLSLTVPAGTYSALEAKIRAVRADSDHGAGSAAFLSAHPELAGVSVLVTGTFNGKAFTYTGAPRAEFETSFSPPVVVAATPTNLTVHVELSRWFKTSSGALIDPASAIGTGANVHAVAENIQRSFRAFRDQNRDGHDDDSGGD